MVKLPKIVFIATLVASVYQLEAMEAPSQNLELHTAIHAIQKARNDYMKLLENENLKAYAGEGRGWKYSFASSGSA